jgi:hypothetical protein
MQNHGKKDVWGTTIQTEQGSDHQPAVIACAIVPIPAHAQSTQQVD